MFSSPGLIYPFTSFSLWRSLKVFFFKYVSLRQKAEKSDVETAPIILYDSIKMPCILKVLKNVQKTMRENWRITREKTKHGIAEMITVVPLVQQYNSHTSGSTAERIIIAISAGPS